MNIGNKRKDTMGGIIKPKRVKKECDYGERCYRRNPAHFREYSHKHLETILDDYTGSGDYPIPDKYILERLTIMEQLDVIIEKDLYTPWRNNSSSHVQESSTNNNTIQPQNSQVNINRSLNRESIIPGMPGSNIHSEASKNSGSSRTTVEASRNARSNSGVPGSSSKNSEASRISVEASRNAKSSSGVPGSSSKNSEASKNSGTSRNASSNSGDEAKSSNNSDYKKAEGYRPIVPPTRRVEDFLTVVRPPGNMAAKHVASAPYHVFYTTIAAAAETHAQPNSITFLEILDSSLGELKCSLQINFMVELGWLLAQYYFAGYSQKKMTILYGEETTDLKTISEKKPHISAYKVSMPPFGTHHTKMMILCYEDGSLRVVISTANLYIDDWENRTQGLWFSPRCPELPSEAMPHDGESETQFKRSLLKYLSEYQLPSLSEYVERVKRCDFSHINVFLVASVPGSHTSPEWGLARAGLLLRQHGAPAAGWPLQAQASSIGSYGPQPKLWLTGDFLHNLTKSKDQTLSSPPELKLIYPSLENVRQSHDGLLGGGCLPYGAAVHTKQPWLNDFLYQWKATESGRNKAMPHIKSYTRISPDNKMAAYYLLTSANASKAAWGSFNKGNGALRIMSYEVGVLLLPKFVINKDYFPLDGDDRLILAYDVPPTKYTSDMRPWVMDYLS